MAIGTGGGAATGIGPCNVCGGTSGYHGPPQAQAKTMLAIGEPVKPPACHICGSSGSHSHGTHYGGGHYEPGSGPVTKALAELIASGETKEGEFASGGIVAGGGSSPGGGGGGAGGGAAAPLTWNVTVDTSAFSIPYQFPATGNTTSLIPAWLATIDPALLARVDAARGPLSRQEFVTAAIEDAIFWAASE